MSPPLIADTPPGVRPVVQIGVGDRYDSSAIAALWGTARWSSPGAPNEWSGTEPLWRDISCEVLDMTTYVGRDGGTVEPFEVGTATVVVRNDTGWADYKPPGEHDTILTIRPGRQMRIGVELQTVPPEPFTPRDIPDLELWLDADDTSTITFGTGNRVASWRSQADNGWTFANAAPSEQPRRTLGGLRVDRYSLDVVSPEALNGPASSGANTKPFSAFVAMKHTGAAIDRAIIGTVYDGGLLWEINPSHRQTVNKHYIAHVGASTTPTPTGTPFVAGVTYSAGGELRFYLNGAADGVITNDQTLTAAVPQSRIAAGGGGQDFVGTIGEVIKFARVLTDAERAQVLEYLRTRWVTIVTPTPPDTSWLYRGTIDTTEPGYLPNEGDVVTFGCIDAKGDAGRARLLSLAAPIGSGEATYQRIGRTLDQIAWPSWRRNLDEDSVTLAGTRFGTSVAEEMDRSAESGSGHVYGDVDGCVRFRRKDWMVWGGDDPPFATIGNIGATDVCPSGWEMRFGRDDITSRAIVGRRDEAPIVMDNPDALGMFGVETWERADLLPLDDAELTRIGSRVLAARSPTVMPRITAVTLHASTGDGEVAELLAQASAFTPTRLRCRHRAWDGRLVFDRMMLVVGVAHTISPRDGWTARLSLDDAWPHKQIDNPARWSESRWSTDDQWALSL